MDEFKNLIDIEKFRKTNGPWNDLMLNDPWSVGYVSMLIELKTFNKKEEWESFYYEMGEYRNKQLKKLPDNVVSILENELLIKNDKPKVNNLSWDLKNINTQNGRSVEQLKKKGDILYNNIHRQFPDITEEDCFQAVRFRVICETWNGIILREHNTVKSLMSKFKKLEFIKKEGDFDHKYAVDYEIYNQKTLVCGIQIKPKSYTFNTPYLIKAKYANAQKNKKYTEDYEKPVFYIISSGKGFIYNDEVLDKIADLL